MWLIQPLLHMKYLKNMNGVNNSKRKVSIPHGASSECKLRNKSAKGRVSWKATVRVVTSSNGVKSWWQIVYLIYCMFVCIQVRSVVCGFCSFVHPEENFEFQVIDHGELLCSKQTDNATAGWRTRSYPQRQRLSGPVGTECVCIIALCPELYLRTQF